MAEPRPVPSLDSPSSELDYRPPSGVAVAAILVAGIYILIVLGTAITAIANKRPALNVSLVLVAIPALALSIAARVHIRRSEGTRIGLQLASAAWWLSMLGGVGFGAYIFASVVALRQQSERAAGEWFDLLKNGDVDAAFVMTIPPMNRQNVNPKDTQTFEARFGGGGFLAGFRSSELVRFFRRNGQDVDVQPLGMSEWEQIDNGYRVSLAYSLRNAEGEFEVNLQLTGVEGDNFPGRQWRVEMPEGNLNARGFTPYGWMVNELDREARGYALEWISNVGLRALADVVSAAAPPEEQAAMLAKFVAWQINSHLPPWWGQSKPEGPLGVSIFDYLWGNDFFKLDRPEPMTSENRDTFRKVWELGVIVPGGTMRLVNADTSPQLTIGEKGVEYRFPLEIRLPGQTVNFAKGRLVLAAESPEFVKQAMELKKTSLANHQISRTPPAGGIGAMAPRNWRVVRLQSDLEPLPSAQRQQDQ